MAEIAWSDRDADAVRRLRAQVRRDRQSWGFPLVALGIAGLLAIPLYIRPTPAGGTRAFAPTILGFEDIGLSGSWVGLYWVAALTLVYVASALHYRRRLARRGLAGSVRPFVATGVVIVVLLILWTPSVMAAMLPSVSGAYSFGNQLWGRGLTPLLIVALGVLVLAWTERSRALTAIGVAYLAVAVVANLYDLGNLYYTLTRHSLGRYELLPNLLAPALLLLVAGVIAARHRKAR